MVDSPGWLAELVGVGLALGGGLVGCGVTAAALASGEAAGDAQPATSPSVSRAIESRRNPSIAALSRGRAHHALR
jgi:hypothetical protein